MPSRAIRRPFAFRPCAYRTPRCYKRKRSCVWRVPASLPASYVSSYSIAESYMRMGEKQKAFEWLEKAYEEHDSGLVSLAVEPMFESIRLDPRFREILRRMEPSR